MRNYISKLFCVLVSGVLSGSNYLSAEGKHLNISSVEASSQNIKVEYLEAGKSSNKPVVLPVYKISVSENSRITLYRDDYYQVVIQEIDRKNYTEINGELEDLSGSGSSATLRISMPYSGEKWKWFKGLDKSDQMKAGVVYTDTVSISTVLPPDGAFNGSNLTDGGYGDAVGRGTMSYYPLCAVGIDNKGRGLGIDLFVPLVYRLGASITDGIFAEFDFSTSPYTNKFPNRAFFKICQFDFNPEWGMRSALKQYYSIFPEAFKKRVINEGIWLPFTSLRSIPGWSDFGFAFHETSWGSSDMKDGKKIPNFISDKETGVLSFQYTEPWDVQLPIKSKSISYDSIVSGSMISNKHKLYLDVSATEDKNGLWHIRRLETPWFKTGWAVSITTNCDPDIYGYNKYQYILQDEIDPALKLNADGIYFDSMEWNWHHDLNYREDHFKFADFPLTFSESVGRPAIWNFSSEFEFMKKIADEMHAQGKLVMGNGHGWNPFAAANLDLFGAELSWYSQGDHNIEALDFKRAISYQKPIVFLLNEGLNDKAFTEAPYQGYEIYFEKMLAYGFFPSFFSVDASNDPYWKDHTKIENGRPFFKKYIPIIKEIADAGWEPVTSAVSSSAAVRIERFGNSDKTFFTARNDGSQDISCDLLINNEELGISEGYSALELVTSQPVIVKGNRLILNVPAGRTRVIRLDQAR